MLWVLRDSFQILVFDLLSLDHVDSLYFLWVCENKSNSSILLPFQQEVYYIQTIKALVSAEMLVSQ